MDILADLLLFQLSPAHLFDDPAPAESSLYRDLLFVLGSAAVLGLLLSLRPQLFAGPNLLHQRILRRYGTWLGWIALVGILVIGLRYTNAPFFSKRLWTLLDVLALLLLAGHGVRYRLTQYPDDAAQYEEEEHRRRFRTGAPGPSRRRRRR